MTAFTRNALMTAIDLIGLYGDGAADVAMARIDAQIASPLTGPMREDALNHWRKVHSLIVSGYLKAYLTRGA